LPLLLKSWTLSTFCEDSCLAYLCLEKQIGGSTSTLDQSQLSRADLMVDSEGGIWPCAHRILASNLFQVISSFKGGKSLLCIWESNLSTLFHKIAAVQRHDFWSVIHAITGLVSLLSRSVSTAEVGWTTRDVFLWKVQRWQESSPRVAVRVQKHFRSTFSELPYTRGNSGIN